MRTLTSAHTLSQPSAVALRAAHPILGGLLGVLALNAFGGGYYGMAGASGVPVELLQGSPFEDYFLPSLILLAVVGGAALMAAVATFARHRFARSLALAAGAIVVGWIAVQVAIIGFQSWLQPMTVSLGLAIIAFAIVLPESPEERYRVRGELARGSTRRRLPSDAM